MKTLLAFLFLYVATMAQAQNAPTESKLADPEALARASSANLGAVSAMLSKNQRQVDAMMTERTDAIVARERAAASAQNLVKRELSVYQNTRGSTLANSLQTMIDAGDDAVAETSAVAATEDKLRTDIKASTVIPMLSTEKLDSAAKRLGVLADEATPAERAKEAFAFLRDTKRAVKKLEQEAKEAKDKADAAPNTATDAKPAVSTNSVSQPPI